MANLTIKSNNYTPTAERMQQSRVNYNGAQIVDQSGYYGKMGKAFGLGLKAIQDREESDETERVLKASNEFAKRASEIKLGIETNMQGSNAKNAAALYEQQMEAARQEVYANSGLKYKAGENMFNRNAYTTTAKGTIWAGEWEKAQTDKAKATTYDLSVDDEINNIVSDPAAYRDGFTRTMKNLSGLFPSLAPEQREAMERATADKMGTSLVSQAIDRNDYSLATEFFDYFNPKMTAGARAKMASAIYQNQEYAENSDLAAALEVTGITDPEEQRQWLISNSGGRNSSGTGGDISSFIGAISGQESGGNYDAVNSRTGASGRYQIMPENWPVWSREAGLPADAPMTPENQDKVAEYKLKQYVDAYGYRGAAIAWYAGPGALEYSEDALNRKQGNGDEPSINEYADAIMARMGISGGDTGGLRSGMSEMRMDKIIKASNAIAAEKERKAKAAQNAAVSAYIQQTYEWQQQGLGYEEAIQLATKMAGGNWDVLNKFTNNINRMYGVKGNGSSSGGGGGSASSMVIDVLKDQLAAKKYPTLESLSAAAGALNVSSKQMYDLTQEWAKYEKGEGVYGYDWIGSIKPRVMGDNTKGTATAQAIAWESTKLALQNDFIPRYRERNGRDPSVYEVVEAGREAMIKQPIGTVAHYYTTYFNGPKTIEYSAADLAGAGIKEITQASDNYFRVVLNNGQIRTLTAKELEQEING